MIEYKCKCDNGCLFQKDDDGALMCESADKCEHAEKQITVEPLTMEEVQDWKRLVYSPQTAAAFYGETVVKELIATIEALDDRATALEIEVAGAKQFIEEVRYGR